MSEDKKWLESLPVILASIDENKSYTLIEAYDMTKALAKIEEHLKSVKKLQELIEKIKTRTIQEYIDGECFTSDNVCIETILGRAKGCDLEKAKEMFPEAYAKARTITYGIDTEKFKKENPEEAAKYTFQTENCTLTDLRKHLTEEQLKELETITERNAPSHKLVKIGE
jgi:hypothetical protein